MLHRRKLFGSLAFVGVLALAAAWAAPAPPTPPSVAARLGKRVTFNGVDDPKATLHEVLERLAKDHELTFELNDKAFAFENVKDVERFEIASPNPLAPMKNVRLDTVLRKVLARVPVPSGATFSVHEDHIEITTGTFLASEVWGDFKGAHLPLVWATLDKIPIEDALRELAEQTHFNVVVDNRAAEKGHTPVTARFRNVPLDTAVRLLTDMADLRSVHLDNVLYVTTKENAAAVEARIDKERGAPLSPDDGDNTPRHRKGTGPNSIMPTAGGLPPAGM